MTARNITLLNCCESEREVTVWNESKHEVHSPCQTRQTRDRAVTITNPRQGRLFHYPRQGHGCCERSSSILYAARGCTIRMPEEQQLRDENLLQWN
jgi:hypothetical protein